MALALKIIVTAIIGGILLGGIGQGILKNERMGDIGVYTIMCGAIAGAVLAVVGLWTVVP